MFLYQTLRFGYINFREAVYRIFLSGNGGGSNNSPPVKTKRYASISFFIIHADPAIRSPIESFGEDTWNSKLNPTPPFRKGLHCKSERAGGVLRRLILHERQPAGCHCLEIRQIGA